MRAVSHFLSVSRGSRAKRAQYLVWLVAFRDYGSRKYGLGEQLLHPFDVAFRRVRIERRRTSLRQSLIVFLLQGLTGTDAIGRPALVRSSRLQGNGT
jgi:hypothetical protein